MPRKGKFGPFLGNAHKGGGGIWAFLTNAPQAKFLAKTDLRFGFII
jgi:hypothetical protein